MNQNCLAAVAASTALLAACGSALGNDLYELVSADEYARTLAAGDEEEFVERAVDPMAPEIEVRAPGDGDDFEAPVDIDIAFVAAPGAEIDLDTLKITYGALGINVTDRVTENAEVTQEGIVSEGAMLPSGRHKLTVYVADTEGRMGKRRFKFRIR